MSSFSFIHCGDLHLGHLQFNESKRLQDFAAAFRRVVDYALKERVSFMLVSGDFFHKRAINAETLSQAVELLTPLKEAAIPVIVIEGNHDKALYQDKNSWLWFLNTQKYIYLLAPRFQEGRLVLSLWDENERSGTWLDLPGGVRIFGLGYLGVTTASRLTEALAYLDGSSGQEDIYTILMLHTAVNRLLGTDLGGIRLEALGGFAGKVNYIALGHIHHRYEIDQWIYNPGSLECVHLDEHAEGNRKGFYHVTVTPSGATASYIDSPYRSVVRCLVDITDQTSAGEIYERVLDKLAALRPPQDSMLQVILQGMAAGIYARLDAKVLTGLINEKFQPFYAEIINQTNLPGSHGLETASLIQREEVEKLVIGELLSRENPWQERTLPQAIQAVRLFKEMVLNGEKEETLSELLLQSGELLHDSPGEEGGVYEEGVGA